MCVGAVAMATLGFPRGAERSPGRHLLSGVRGPRDELHVSTPRGWPVLRRILRRHAPIGGGAASPGISREAQPRQVKGPLESRTPRLPESRTILPCGQSAWGHPWSSELSPSEGSSYAAATAPPNRRASELTRTADAGPPGVSTGPLPRRRRHLGRPPRPDHRYGPQLRPAWSGSPARDSQAVTLGDLCGNDIRWRTTRCDTE
jgi:hypothetical protein